jgi:hypothetical protein
VQENPFVHRDYSGHGRIRGDLDHQFRQRELGYLNDCIRGAVLGKIFQPDRRGMRMLSMTSSGGETS